MMQNTHIFPRVPFRPLFIPAGSGILMNHFRFFFPICGSLYLYIPAVYSVDTYLHPPIPIVIIWR
ncbi:hypothetical protein BDV37DRAFT_41591 [Aspergillus pseudonomiae]|uniref:Uncharacterized protein n=1 Tax=Aspergillus pseudonomiae TaxID=1506151 RepID=A0A5N7CWQ5_9EURO|nr:uncharacterized protein BDV37DRAFT_41591 [Aspergillus pseudonomiae]KAE8398023.1 hypothetical protein BDV37DRAFT_41591 [Aspergillus pseudonomiae]